MIIVKPSDVIHKAYILRVLTKIADNPLLSTSLSFKGGTCASMMGILDRLSVDLDFDQNDGSDEKEMRKEFHEIFGELGFKIQQESQKTLEFFLKYPNSPNERNTLKIDALNYKVRSNIYKPVFLSEINRTVNCQTKETIFANKLVAVKDRYNQNKSIAGRDIYDIHYFFFEKLGYNKEVIEERTGVEANEYLRELYKFIDKNVTQVLIDQDLNTLLPLENYKRIRKTLKTETLMFLDNEIKVLSVY